MENLEDIVDTILDEEILFTPSFIFDFIGDIILFAIFEFSFWFISLLLLLLLFLSWKLFLFESISLEENKDLDIEFDDWLFDVDILFYISDDKFE